MRKINLMSTSLLGLLAGTGMGGFTSPAIGASYRATPKEYKPAWRFNPGAKMRRKAIEHTIGLRS